MTNSKLGRKVLVVAILGLVLVLALGAVRARASFWSDVWDSIKKPFVGSSEQNQTQDGTEEKVGDLSDSKTEVPLYKPALDYEQAVIAAVKKASPAVVSITVSKNVPIIENCPYGPFSNLPPEFRRFFGDDFFGFGVPCERGTEFREVGGGSGFIVSADGLVVTNKHVVWDDKAAYTVFTNDGRKYDAAVLARDPVQDLAVIKISGSDFPTVTLGNSDAIELGQSAIAIGNALGEFRNTVSVGVISGLARDVTASGGGGLVERITGLIQTDAAINPGNSGGPLLNLRGEVIGINTAIASGAENIGFAIPINDAKRDIQSVKTTGEIQAPYLGVRYILVTPDLAKKEKLPVDYGALIRDSEDGPGVLPGSPADKAGILAEDIILEIQGRKIDRDNPLATAISRFSVGQTAALKISRQGKIITLNVTLGKRPTE